LNRSAHLAVNLPQQLNGLRQELAVSVDIDISSSPAPSSGARFLRSTPGDQAVQHVILLLDGDAAGSRAAADIATRLRLHGSFQVINPAPRWAQVFFIDDLIGILILLFSKPLSSA